METAENTRIDEKLAQFFTQNMGELRDLIQLTDSEVEALYTEAYDYYQVGNYEEALVAFSTLVQVSHLEKRFHLGYAATLQCMGLYAEAIQAYMLASTLDLVDPEPALRIGYCLMQLKNYTDAKNVLSLVAEQTAGEEAQSDIHNKAKNLIDEIERLQFI